MNIRLLDILGEAGRFRVVNAEGVEQHIGFAVTDDDNPEYVCTEGDFRNVADDFNQSLAQKVRDEFPFIMFRNTGDDEMEIVGVIVSASREYAVGFAHGSGANRVYDLYEQKALRV